jgi:hypothetical protein
MMCNMRFVCFLWLGGVFGGLEMEGAKGVLVGQFSSGSSVHARDWAEEGVRIDGSTLLLWR